MLLQSRAWLSWLQRRCKATRLRRIQLQMLSLQAHCDMCSSRNRKVVQWVKSMSLSRCDSLEDKQSIWFLQSYGDCWRVWFGLQLITVILLIPLRDLVIAASGLDLSNLEAMLLDICILTTLVFDIFVRYLGSHFFCDLVLLSNYSSEGWYKLTTVLLYSYYDILCMWTIKSLLVKGFSFAACLYGLGSWNMF